MSKVFRLYREGDNTYRDWYSTPAYPYNQTNRDTIDDPDGSSSHNEITSIPSPFARIDLVKNAFKQVSKADKRTRKADLDGSTIFHKMVSDSLDVAEIFFNIDKYPGKIQIIKWDPDLMLDELEKSDIKGHKYLADSLWKYKVSDANTYNFGNLKCIYLLNYIDGPDELNIIGATSPATLFFSNANDLSYVDGIFFGEDKPFDNDYQPLYKRDPEFIKYWFALRNSIHNFAGLFPEVDLYLSATLLAITDQDLKNVLKNVSAQTLDDFNRVYVDSTQQSNYVEVLGNPLYKKAIRAVDVSSDFTIKTGHEISGKLPLVLPIEAGNRYCQLQYTTGKWGKDNKAAYNDDEIDLSKRKLPFDGSIHPYLTIGDFLENSIIKVPHTLNTSNYFDGFINIQKQGLGYLLPIKPLLFKYFDIDDLCRDMPDGKRMFEMTLLSGDSISVTLRIPIKGDGNVSYIEYSRLYYNNSTADAKNNAGNIVEMKFTGFIMPQVKFVNEHDALYNIACIHANQSKYDFSFFKSEERLSITKQPARDDNYTIKADNYLLKGLHFDYIQVCNNQGIKGILIPIFKPQKNIEEFKFAIDLGTSNTHIEYKKGSDASQPFAFSANDRQLCEMFLPTINNYGYIDDLGEETELLEKDFIPAIVGNGDFKFPTRTVLSCAKIVDWKRNIDPYVLVNLPFTYDKRSDFDYNNIKYNIKWGYETEQRVMDAYIKCLMLMIRNKVLLNNGDLSKTKITWFYPISMEPKRKRRLEETWNEAFKEYFVAKGNESSGVNQETHCMTESAAPIEFFFKRYATATSLVNVDIGGGTTDIAFAKDREIKHVTSFRFASNALFENSYSELDDKNGIVDFYKDQIYKVLEEKKLSELMKAFNSSNNKEHPSNMASFLFGLSSNTILKNHNINEKAVDFSYKLGIDEDFKIVFIIFYSAIIYHIAQITKELNLDMPRHISFSGNGSKVIRIITTDSKLLARYTKLIFEKVLGKPYDKELELLGLDKDSNPKDSTCKGGLLSDEDEDCRDLSIVLKGDGSGIVQRSDTYDSINEVVRKGTIEAVEAFFRFVFIELKKNFDFDKNFGMREPSLKVAYTAAMKDLRTYLDKGIANRLEETEKSNIIEESLFFYPIKGALQEMSAEIFNSLNI